MHSPDDTAEGSFWPNLAILAFALCFAGSSVYVVAPIRPFHLGVVLTGMLFLLNADWRKTLLNSRTLPLLLGTATLLLMSWPWAINLKRYVEYAAMLCIGLSYMTLGEAMARRRLPFVEWLLPICLLWFITSFFSFFDVWTDTTSLRHALLFTGGVWRNVNDMATALIYACLVWMLIKRRLPLTLFAACWFYAMLLNRRADLVAVGILGMGYLLLFARENTARLRLAAVWVIAGILAFSLQDSAFKWGALPTFAQQSEEQCSNIHNDTVPLDLVASGCVSAPPGTPPRSAPALPGGPVPPMPPATQAMPAMPSLPGAIPELTSDAPFILPTVPLDASVLLGPIHRAVSTDLIAHDGDVSTAVRGKMVLEMWDQAQAMPWWQWLTGKGVGQLDLVWPLTDAHWASPHFFWLEMFFYVGLPWFIFLGWLFLRSDGLARLALLSGAVAGMAPSSLIYFQPFWFLLGVVLACLPPRPPRHRNALGS